MQELGVHTVCVAGDADRPAHAFSVGLFLNYGHPEVLVVGLPAASSTHIVQRVHAIVQRGEAFAPGLTSDDVIEGYPVTFLRVGQEHYGRWLSEALWFYRSMGPDGFPCLQMVWPSRDGHFPWDGAFDASLRSQQPLVGSM